VKKKIWIKDIHGESLFYFKPIPIGQEFSLLTELAGMRLDYESLPFLFTKTASIVLDLPPDEVEERFTSETLTQIFRSVREDLASEVRIPTRPQKKGRVQAKKSGEVESKSYQEYIMDLISFLLYYSNLTLQEIMACPKQFLIDLYFNLLELIELDRDFEFQISAVSALSALSGGGDNDKEAGVFDLTTDEGLEAILSMPGLVEVQNG